MNRFSMLLLVIAHVWLASCFPEGHDRCGDGYRFENDNCLKRTADTPSKTGSEDAGPDSQGIDEEKWIGSPCTCVGDQCRIVGVPSLVYGTIVGCEDVPGNWPGAVPGCWESYEGDFIRSQYFAKGFCTLISVSCSGNDLVCSASNIGELEAMTSCPKNTVMITYDYDEDVQGLSSHLTRRYCVPTCERDSDCRVDTFDEILGEPGQYHCIDKNGVKFCLDPRNLTDDYSAEAF